MEKNDLFAAIFADAFVLDVDFSNWDKFIGFCVVGIDVEYPLPKRLPLFLVEFKNVYSFQCTFCHLGISLDDENEHFQWGIHDFERTKKGNQVHIKLKGSGNSPNLEIICESYVIRPLANDTLDKLFPGWADPGGPLVRPNIEMMASGLKRKKS